MCTNEWNVQIKQGINSISCVTTSLLHITYVNLFKSISAKISLSVALGTVKWVCLLQTQLLVPNGSCSKDELTSLWYLNKLFMHLHLVCLPLSCWYVSLCGVHAQEVSWPRQRIKRIVEPAPSSGASFLMVLAQKMNWHPFGTWVSILCTSTLYVFLSLVGM